MQIPYKIYSEKKVFGDTQEITIKFLSHLSLNKNVFEFGTFRGQTTYNLSKKANKVYTFDLGTNNSNEGYPNYEVGEIYKKNNTKNITQLIGNSTLFNFEEYYQKFDLVWLDGGHSYEVCKKDFETSLKLIRPKNQNTSIIIIDDYPSWKGVKKAVEEIALTKNLYYISELGVVVYLNQ